MAGKSTNVPNIGQKAVGGAGAPRRVVPAGQGSNALTTRGGPPVAAQLAKQTKGGRSTINSTPAP